jgi:hypothetical protein
MITVGTPGLGVRQPHGKSSGWEIRQCGPIRVADAQTGRPYSNHFQYRESFSNKGIIFNTGIVYVK